MALGNDPIFSLYAEVDVNVRNAINNLKKIENAAEDSAEAIKELGNTPAATKKQANAILSAEKKIIRQRERERTAAANEREEARKSEDRAIAQKNKEIDLARKARRESSRKATLS